MTYDSRFDLIQEIKIISCFGTQDSSDIINIYLRCVNADADVSVHHENEPHMMPEEKSH
jgi:hypothetical protein